MSPCRPQLQRAHTPLLQAAQYGHFECLQALLVLAKETLHDSVRVPFDFRLAHVQGHHHVEEEEDSLHLEELQRTRVYLTVSRIDCVATDSGMSMASYCAAGGHADCLRLLADFKVGRMPFLSLPRTAADTRLYCSFPT